MAKNRIIFGLVVAILLLFIFLREDPMTYLALYAVLMTPLFSLAFTFVVGRIKPDTRGGKFTLSMKRDFVVSEKLSANFVTKGQFAQYICTVKNRSILPCPSACIRFEAEGLGIELDITEKLIAIAPRKSFTIHVWISAKYRGNFRVGVQSVTLYDFLGLFKFKQGQDKTFVFTVTPQIRSISPLPLDVTIREGLTERSFLRNEAYGIVSDLKKYQPTDSFKKIHWKVSAKRNELISRHFKESEKFSAMFLLDNSTIEGEPLEALVREDNMMEVLVSSMAQVHQMGYSLILRYLGSKDMDTTENFDFLYNIASGLHFGDFGNFDDYFDHAAPAYEDSQNLLLFVQKLSERTFTSLRSLRLSGSSIIVFYFPQWADENKLEKLRESGIHCIDYNEV